MFKDLENMTKKIATMMDERFDTPGEKKKYDEALKSPELKAVVSKAMEDIRKSIKL